MNRRVDIGKISSVIKTLLVTHRVTVDYSVGKNIYMLPSNMKLKIKTGTVGYNNKILVSNGNFSQGKNENVNLTTP